MRVKWRESARVAALVKAKPNRCFTNCYRVIKQVDGYDAALLVRGVLTLQTPNDTAEEEHVWIEKDGGIIDPTITLVRKKGEIYRYRPKRKFNKLPKVGRVDGALFPLGNFYDE